MNGIIRQLAVKALLATERLLPPHLSSWARAMGRELAEISSDRAALDFAVGCLRAALTLAIGAQVQSLRDATRGTLLPLSTSTWSLPTMNSIWTRPRLLGLFCGAGAAALGLAYLFAAGAPSHYLLVNLAALVIGATAWLALSRTEARRVAGTGPAVLALAMPILLTAFFGVAAEGASRWLSFGPLSVQVSLILLPPMVVLYARRADAIGTAGMIVAAFALAAQPDRGMAGVLLAGLVALMFAAPSRLATLSAGAAMLSFGWTLLKPDTFPGSPYVDGILYTAFDVHLFAGLAVVIGALVLVIPAAIGASQTPSARPALLAFGGCWLAVVIAAALGNNPTPVVGYGGSAVLGYLLSVALLPNGVREIRSANAPRSRAVTDQSADPMAQLRAASLS